MIGFDRAKMGMIGFDSIGALKARSIVAWGNAPGAEQPRIRRAEGPR
jgi:hypothetical protein